MSPVRAKAVVVSRPPGLPHPLGLRVIEGDHAGAVFVLDGVANVGDQVVAEFYPADQFARFSKPEPGAPITLSAEAADMIEAALREGFANCGEDPDCLWAEPLRMLVAARKGVA